MNTFYSFLILNYQEGNLKINPSIALKYEMAMLFQDNFILAALFLFTEISVRHKFVFLGFSIWPNLLNLFLSKFPYLCPH